MNCLLDNGANINMINHEGVSPLAACTILYYPVRTFKKNIAELTAATNKKSKRYRQDTSSNLESTLQALHRNSQLPPNDSRPPLSSFHNDSPLNTSAVVDNKSQNNVNVANSNSKVGDSGGNSMVQNLGNSQPSDDKRGEIQGNRVIHNKEFASEQTISENMVSYNSLVKNPAQQRQQQHEEVNTGRKGTSKRLKIQAKEPKLTLDKIE